MAADWLRWGTDYAAVSLAQWRLLLLSSYETALRFAADGQSGACKRCSTVSTELRLMP